MQQEHLPTEGLMFIYQQGALSPGPPTSHLPDGPESTQEPGRYLTPSKAVEPWWLV